MLCIFRKHTHGLSILLSSAVVLFGSAQLRSQSPPPGQTFVPLSWGSKARLHQRFKSAPGDFTLSEHDVEFRPARGSPLHWSFIEIKTVNLFQRRLTLTSYENRSWHRPGSRQFHFELSTAIPPSVAAELIKRIGKPAINGNPDPQVPSLATIPARHGTLTGGTNGILRFRDDGIDYVTGQQGGRSWRWADIQTLANPDPYHFRVAGYLETFDFELKQPMSRELFDRLWDYVYARNLVVSRATGENNHETEAKK